LFLPYLVWRMPSKSLLFRECTTTKSVTAGLSRPHRRLTGLWRLSLELSPHCSGSIGTKLRCIWPRELIALIRRCMILKLNLILPKWTLNITCMKEITCQGSARAVSLPRPAPSSSMIIFSRPGFLTAYCPETVAISWFSTTKTAKWVQKSTFSDRLRISTRV